VVAGAAVVATVVGAAVVDGAVGAAVVGGGVVGGAVVDVVVDVVVEDVVVVGAAVVVVVVPDVRTGARVSSAASSPLHAARATTARTASAGRRCVRFGRSLRSMAAIVVADPGEKGYP
jgi:hypothetical protein